MDIQLRRNVYERLGWTSRKVAEQHYLLFKGEEWQPGYSGTSSDEAWRQAPPIEIRHHLAFSLLAELCRNRFGDEFTVTQTESSDGWTCGLTGSAIGSRSWKDGTQAVAICRAILALVDENNTAKAISKSVAA
jgi:hypothetical protein